MLAGHEGLQATLSGLDRRQLALAQRATTLKINVKALTATTFIIRHSVVNDDTGIEGKKMMTLRPRIRVEGPDA